jgi:hypothetical protein
VGWFKRWRSRGFSLNAEPQPQNAKVRLLDLTFSDGTSIRLKPDTVLVLTGPNNVCKSASLREIRDYLTEGIPPGPVLRKVTLDRTGSIADFSDTISKAGLQEGDGRFVKIGRKDYRLSSIEEDYDKSFVSSPPMQFFVAHLGAGERLELTEPIRRADYAYSGPSEPLQWLEFDEDAEEKVSTIFERTFGMHLILNTLGGEQLSLHVAASRGPDQATTHRATAARA